MRKLLFAIAFLSLPSAAWAQCTGTFSPGNVCGNAGASPAPPAQAPLSAFGGGGGGGGGGATITRVQIPSTHLGTTSSLVLNGYRTANDLGYGAPYTCLGQTSSSWNAIQNADGQWCGLNFAATDRINVGWFGAFADNGATKITAPDVAANPQWRQSPVYPVGTSWDTVATQEAKYAAYAGQALPNSMPGTGDFSHSWNAGVGNKIFFVPNGTYGINQQIYSHQQGFIDVFASKGHALWNWIGPINTIMWLCDSCAYGQMFNLSVGSSTPNDYDGNAPIPLVSLDNVGSGNSSGLKTQQVTLYDMYCAGNSNWACTTISRSGGAAQGDTITFVNPIWIGGGANTALILGGNNTLDETIIGGDCQGFIHDCVQSNGGSITTYGFHTENQASVFNQFTPSVGQIPTRGADFDFPGAVSTEVSHINGARSEGDVLLQNDGGAPVDVFSSEVIGVSANDWFANFGGQPLGSIIRPGANNTKGRTFMLVDAGGPAANGFGPGGTAWRVPSAVNGPQTQITDNTLTSTLNQYAGFTFYWRFGSNGFTTHCTGGITGNTAGPPTVITVNSGCASAIGGVTPSSFYTIEQQTGASAPNFDSAGNGTRMPSGNVGQGFMTNAGDNHVAVGSFDVGNITPNVTYIFIPNADKLGTSRTVDGGAAGIFPAPLVALVTAIGGSCSFSSGFSNCLTITKPAAFSVGANNAAGGAGGWYGTPIADNTNLKWMALPYNTLDNVRVVSGFAGGTPSGTLLMSATGVPPGSVASNTCNVNTKGSSIVVNDATAPTYNATYVGGGTITVPLVCDGTNWKTH